MRLFRGSLVNDCGLLEAHDDVELDVERKYQASNGAVLTSSTGAVHCRAHSVSLTERAVIRAYQLLDVSACYDIRLNSQAGLFCHGDVNTRCLFMLNKGQVKAEGKLKVTVGHRPNKFVPTSAPSDQLRLSSNVYLRVLEIDATATEAKEPLDQDDIPVDAIPKNTDGEGAKEGCSQEQGFLDEGELVNVGGCLVAQLAVEIYVSSRVTNAQYMPANSPTTGATAASTSIPAYDAAELFSGDSTITRNGIIASLTDSLSIAARGDIHNDFDG